MISQPVFIISLFKKKHLNYQNMAQLGALAQTYRKEERKKLTKKKHSQPKRQDTSDPLPAGESIQSRVAFGSFRSPRDRIVSNRVLFPNLSKQQTNTIIQHVI